MQLNNRNVKVRLPEELVELMKSQSVNYTTTIRDILLNHYNLDLVKIKQGRK